MVVYVVVVEVESPLTGMKKIEVRVVVIGSSEVIAAGATAAEAGDVAFQPPCAILENKERVVVMVFNAWAFSTVRVT